MYQRTQIEMMFNVFFFVFLNTDNIIRIKNLMLNILI